MTINIIEYIKNNFEELLTMLISTIITISVIMQRTKINRKVKDMQKITLEELTIEELENELERRKEITLKPREKTPYELYKEEEEALEREIKEYHNFVNNSLEIYREVKNSLKILNNYKHKFKYKEEVEKELEKNDI